MQRSTQLIDTLQNAGLRLTPQRVAVCELLAGTKAHPTAQMIYDTLRPQYPSLSLATVYNTLDTLVSLGVVNSLGSAGDDSIHYDADTTPHINLACTSCHAVIDIPSQFVQALEGEVASSSGYQITGARVLYYGLCPDCQAKTHTEQKQ